VTIETESLEKIGKIDTGCDNIQFYLIDSNLRFIDDALYKNLRGAMALKIDGSHSHKISMVVALGLQGSILDVQGEEAICGCIGELGSIG
jgi:hypothetical protein